MEKIKSKKDVILCRGIWYVSTLLSIVALSISLNRVWPPGDCLSSSSRFFRDGAVSATTFYAVMLLRYFFFSDPDLSTYYRKFTACERFSQFMFTHLASFLIVVLPLLIVLKHKVWFSFFITSVFTGGLGLIQLSEKKFKMEMRVALMTLFSFYLHGFFVVFLFLYLQKYEVLGWFLMISCGFLQSIILYYTHPDEFASCCLPT